MLAALLQPALSTVTALLTKTGMLLLRRTSSASCSHFQRDLPAMLLVLLLLVLLLVLVLLWPTAALLLLLLVTVSLSTLNVRNSLALSKRPGACQSGCQPSAAALPWPSSVLQPLAELGASIVQLSATAPW